MTFPPHIAAVLDGYGVQPATKAALYDLYVALGSDVLEAFAELASGLDVREIDAEQVASLRRIVIEGYVRKNHPLWERGNSTPSLWHPRVLEGRVAGVVRPIGELDDSDDPDDFSASVMSVIRNVLPSDQPLPKGVLLLGKNAHYGGRFETVSFDIVTHDVDDAVAAALAEGQQHTIPGSVGETSGTVDMKSKLFLIWEIQPNVYKPSEERNSAVSKLWRRHRNWHVATLSAAIMWAMRHSLTTFVLRGEYLSVAHEVNARKPVTEAIVAMHNRTIASVAAAIGAELKEATAAETLALRDAELPNHALSTFITDGSEPMFLRIELRGEGGEH